MKNDNKKNSLTHTIYNQTQNHQHRKLYDHNKYNKNDDEYSETQVFISIPNSPIDTNFHESFPKEQVIINQKSENGKNESFLQKNFNQPIQNTKNHFEKENEENRERKYLSANLKLINNFVDGGTEQVSKLDRKYSIVIREEVEDVCVICLHNFDDYPHFQVHLLDQELNKEKNIHKAHNSQWHEECIVQWIKVNSKCPLCHEILKDPRVQENNTTAVQIVPNNDDMMYWKEYFLVNFLMAAILITLIVSFPNVGQ
jgi:hypothetical protein